MGLTKFSSPTNSQTQSSGFDKPSSFEGFGKLGGFGKTDLNDVGTLLQLAQSQGGALGQVANELLHPTTSILSTIGNGFKKAFGTFVDIISVPSEIVAGALSSKYSIPEAVAQKLKPSDVLFGELDSDSTTMQKVGSFVVRTATDILLDPLTYVTFGASQGIAGLTGATKITAGENLATFLGKEGAGLTGDALAQFIAKKSGSAVALSAEGADIFKYLKGVENQSLGLTKMLGFKAGNSEAFELAGKELKMLLESTIDSPLNPDLAKKALSNMLEKNPGLAETILDKGGIKFFGKSILSGQRIQSAITMIPGMTALDHMTAPYRLGIESLFNPKLVKEGGVWQRIPEELGELETKARNLAASLKDERGKKLVDIIKSNNLTPTQGEFLRAAIEADKLPVGEELANAFMQAKGYNAEELAFLRESGFTVTKLDNHVPRILLDEKASNLAVVLPPKAKAGATFERGIANYVNVETGVGKIGSPETLGLTKHVTADEVKNIISKTTQILEKKGASVEKFQKEIGDLSVFVNDFFQGKVTKEFEARIAGMPIADQENVRQFMNVMKGEMGTIDVEKLASGFAQKTMKEGVKVPADEFAQAIGGLSEDAVKTLKEKIAKGESWMGMDMDILNDALKNSVGKKPTQLKIPGITTSQELTDLAKKLKLESSAKRFAFASGNIDRNALAGFVKGLKEQMEKDPTGIKKALESIIGKKQEITDLLSEMELAKTAMKTDIASLPEAANFFKNEHGEIFKRVQASIAEMDAAGFDHNFDPNLFTALAARTMDNVNAGVGRQYIHNVIERFGKPASEASQGWRRIDLSAVSEEAAKALNVMGKSGEEMYFHPAVAKRVESFIGSVIKDDATNDFLKAFDSLQNMWKASVTSVFPAFHGRNAISNVFQNFLDLGLHAINPATHGMSTSLVYADRRLATLETVAAGVGEKALAAREEIQDMMSKKIFTDVTGFDWTLGELRTTMRRNGIAFTGRSIGPGDLQAGKSGLESALFEVEKSVKEKAVDLVKKPFEVGSAIGTAVEEQARVLNFITNLRKTGDVGMAVQRTKQFLFDYQNLTKFEKTFMRRVIPFYTFTRKNIELQARTLLSTPGRISSEITGLSNLGDIFAGGQLSEEDKAKLPDWINSGISILAKKNGNAINVIGSLGTPIEQPFSALQPNQFFGAFSPILRLPFEQLTGYNIFSGKFLSDMTDATGYKHAPKVVQDFIGYTEVQTKDKKGNTNTMYVSLRPERMNLINNLPPTTRVLTSLRQIENENVTDGNKIMQQLMGVRVYSFDLEQEAQQRENEMKRKLQDLLTKAKVTARMNRVFIPKE